MRTTRMPLALLKCKDEGQFRLNGFRWLLTEEADVTGKRLVDLGAGPCHFSRIAAEFGAEVTAVDAREVRVPEDIMQSKVENQGAERRFLSVQRFRIPVGGGDRGRVDQGPARGDKDRRKIRFVHCDVRSFDVEPFEIVLLFGLLYHFSIEDQVRLLERCRGKLVLVDTMVCYPDLVARYPQDEWQSVVEQQGEYEGCIYPEKANPMAAVGNRTSFWHTEASYARLFSRCGFDDVTAYRPFYLAKYGLRSFFRLS